MDLFIHAASVNPAATPTWHRADLQDLRAEEAAGDGALPCVQPRLARARGLRGSPAGQVPALQVRGTH